ncbi:MAG: hypothetical protein AAGH90_10680 [Pseudomonadota bacterium]
MADQEYQGSDISIPVIEICEGWTVEDLLTEDDCDDAFAFLIATCAKIEGRLEALERADEKGTSEYIRAKSALRFKKAALQIVQTTRGRLNRARRAEDNQRADRVMLDFIRQRHPDAFSEAVQAALRVNPDG